MSTGSRRRSRIWLVLVLFGVGIVGVALAPLVGSRFFDDPLGDRFLVGVELEGSIVILHVGDCLGGVLLGLSLATHSEQDRTGEPLWAIETLAPPTIRLAPGEVSRFVVGESLEGMREVQTPSSALPSRTLVAHVETTRQSYGYFFRLDELEPGRILSYRGALSRDQFREEVLKACDGYPGVAG